MFLLDSRLLYQDKLKAEIRSLSPNSNDAQTLAMIRRWFIVEHGQHQQHLFEDNRYVSEWLQGQFDSKNSLVSENLVDLKRNAIHNELEK